MSEQRPVYVKQVLAKAYVKTDAQRPIVVRSKLYGVPGEKGDPGITVSATPPPDPQEGDLWLDIS